MRTTKESHARKAFGKLNRKPIPLEEQPKKNKRDEIIKGVQDSYAMSGTPVDTADDVPIKMKGRVVDLTEEEKAEQLKDKILESLKLND